MSAALSLAAPPRFVAPSPEPVRARLLDSPHLSAAERDVLSDAFRPAQPVRAGAELVREGERADRLYLVTGGWACRYSTTRDGGRQISGIAVPGDVANLDSLLLDRIDTGVRALTVLHVVEARRDKLLALAAEHPEIARTYTWAALVENAILGRWAMSLGRRSARGKLAHLLCELAVRLDAERGGAAGYDFPITQEQVADMLGLTPVHVNRTIQQLRQEGLVAMGNRRMSLPQMGRLRQVAGFDPRYLHLDEDADGRGASAPPA